MERKQAVIFGHLLKQDLRNGLALCFAGLTFGAAFAVFLPDQAGLWGLLAMMASAAATVVALMRRSPWYSDEAFWRTRPVSVRMFWAVRSTTFLLILGLPVGLATAWSLSGLGMLTVGLGVWLIGGIALLVTGVTAVISAIGSKGGGWAVTAVIVFLLPQVLWAIPVLFYTIGVLDAGADWSRGMFLLSCGLLVLLGMVWLAWFACSRTKPSRWKLSLVVLAFGSASWPLLLVNFYHATYDRLERETAPKDEAYELEPSEVGFVRGPLQVAGLDENEFFVSDRVVFKNIDGGSRTKETTQWVPAHGGWRNATEVFFSAHYDFNRTVKVDSIWRHLREQLPELGEWKTHDEPRSSALVDRDDFDQYLQEYPDLEVAMNGTLYRFLEFKPIRDIGPQVIDNELLPGYMELNRVNISGPTAIDLHLNWTRAMVDRKLKKGFIQESLKGVEPPDFWAILYHGPSGRAFGAASVRLNDIGEGPASILRKRIEIGLSFELPRVDYGETGPGAREILEESELYLFAVEPVAFARADFGPSQRNP